MSKALATGITLLGLGGMLGFTLACAGGDTEQVVQAPEAGVEHVLGVDLERTSLHRLHQDAQKLRLLLGVEQDVRVERDHEPPRLLVREGAMEGRPAPTLLEDYDRGEVELDGATWTTWTLQEELRLAFAEEVLGSDVEALRERLDGLGLSEYEVVPGEAADEIVVRVGPLDEDTALSEVLTRPGRLSFLFADDAYDRSRLQSILRKAGIDPDIVVGEETELLNHRLQDESLIAPNERLVWEDVREGEERRAWIVYDRPILTNEDIESVALLEGGLTLQVKLGPRGTRAFGDATSGRVGEPLLIVVDDRVIAAPVIREPIHGGEVQIHLGGASEAEARALQALLSAPALRAPIEVREVRTFGDGG